MRVLAKLADYSEYLQRMGARTSETHPKIDAQLINGYVNKVASKGRYTLTEIEGYDVGRGRGVRGRFCRPAAFEPPITSW